MTDYKKMLDELVAIIVKEDGSDLHLSQDRNPYIRVSGALVPLLKIPPLSGDDLYGLLDHLVTPENKQRFLETKEVDFSYGHGARHVFAVTAFFIRQFRP